MTKTVCTAAKPVEVVFEGAPDVTGRVQLGAGNKIKIAAGGSFQGGFEIGTGAEVRIAGTVCAGQAAARRCAEAEGRMVNGSSSGDPSEEDRGFRVDGTVVVDGDAEVRGTVELADNGQIEINEGTRLKLRPPGRFSGERTSDLLRRPHWRMSNDTDGDGSSDGGSISSGSLVLRRGSILEIADDEDAPTESGVASGRRNATTLRLAVGQIESSGKIEIKGRRVKVEAGAMELTGSESRLEVSGQSRLELDAPIVGTRGGGVVVRRGGRMQSRPLWSAAYGMTSASDAAARRAVGRFARSAESSDTERNGTGPISPAASAALAAGGIELGRAMTREVRRLLPSFGATGDNKTMVSITTAGQLVDLSGHQAWREAIEGHIRLSFTWRAEDDEDMIYGSMYNNGAWEQMRQGVPRPFGCGGTWAATNSSLEAAVRAMSLSIRLATACAKALPEAGSGTLSPQDMAQGAASKLRQLGFPLDGLAGIRALEVCGALAMLRG